MSRQAYALDTLLAEVNQHAPHRSKASDGGLASAQHHAQNPSSDHEPNAAGVWRARDFTHDPAGGLDCHELAALLVARLGHHPAMMSGAYIIWNQRIYSFNRAGEGWRHYDGVNPHTKHLHLSVSTDAAGYDSRVPWKPWASSTPAIDHAVDDLAKAIAARKPGPVRRALRAARQAALAARAKARGQA